MLLSPPLQQDKRTMITGQGTMARVRNRLVTPSKYHGQQMGKACTGQF